MTRHQGDPVAMRVVTFLGTATIVGLIAAAVLCFTSLRYEGNENGAVVIAIVGNLASAALAALGSILASTGKGSPQPVTVENPPSDPVPTTPQTPSGFAVGDPSAPLKES